MFHHYAVMLSHCMWSPPPVKILIQVLEEERTREIVRYFEMAEDRMLEGERWPLCLVPQYTSNCLPTNCSKSKLGRLIIFGILRVYGSSNDFSNGSGNVIMTLVNLQGIKNIAAIRVLHIWKIDVFF